MFYHLTFGGADTYVTSYTIMKVIKMLDLKPDLILTGNESADGGTAHVPVQLAEWLKIPHVTNASIARFSDEEKRILVDKKTEGGYIEYSVKLPAVISIRGNSNEPRYITAYGVVGIREKKISVITNTDLNEDERKIGIVGSPTQSGNFIIPTNKREAKEITGSPQNVAQCVIAILKKNGVCISGGRTYDK